MYGTIARFKIQPGKEDELVAQMKEFEQIRVDGWVASAFYRADAGGDEYWLAVVFSSQETYRANAESPEQDARYQRMRALLTADPQWHDGEVILRQVASS
jgi:heme-degrading monooxygenase HmoA